MCAHATAQTDGRADHLLAAIEQGSREAPSKRARPQHRVWAPCDCCARAAGRGGRQMLRPVAGTSRKSQTCLISRVARVQRCFHPGDWHVPKANPARLALRAPSRGLRRGNPRAGALLGRRRREAHGRALNGAEQLQSRGASRPGLVRRLATNQVSVRASRDAGGGRGTVPTRSTQSCHRARRRWRA